MTLEIEWREWLAFSVPGVPVGKKAPTRAVRPNGRGGHYIATFTPKETADFEARVFTAAMLARNDRGDSEPWDGPTLIDVTIRLPRPKGAPRRVLLPATKPDSSNVLKSIEDGAQGVLWINDSRITDHTIRKRFGDPGVDVLVWRGVAVEEGGPRAVPEGTRAVR